MPTPPRAYLPDLLYAAGKVRAGAALSVRGGLVAAVGEPAIGCEWVRLKRTAILPGLVSAHSQAFQRAVRARMERATHGCLDWRRLRDAAAERLGPDDLFEIARMCFHDMARAGITTVGEFHCLHRDPAGRPYGDPNELAKQVARAAREVGIRLVLLRAAYARGGQGEPPSPAQRRFIEPSADEVLRNVDDLEAELCGDPLFSLCLAPHSVRACPADWIERLAEQARRSGLPLHLRLAEQRAEVAQCQAEHGTTPVLLLDRLGALADSTTAVHAVHLTGDDVAALGRAGATVCACPTAQRRLGQGMVPADRLLAAGARLALGTESNVEIDLLADARLLEHQLRPRRLERAPPEETGDGERGALARRLHAIATSGGMASLGVPGGHLAPGEPADFVVLNLDDPSMAGASEASLPAAVVFSPSRTAVRDVYAGGEPAVLGGVAAPRRASAAEVARGFEAVLRRLWE